MTYQEHKTNLSNVIDALRENHPQEIGSADELDLVQLVAEAEEKSGEVSDADDIMMIVTSYYGLPLSAETLVKQSYLQGVK